MIYFGDHLFSDLRGPSKSGWRTAAIIHELEVCLQLMLFYICSACMVKHMVPFLMLEEENCKWFITFIMTAQHWGSLHYFVNKRKVGHSLSLIFLGLQFRLKDLEDIHVNSTFVTCMVFCRILCWFCYIDNLKGYNRVYAYFSWLEFDSWLKAKSCSHHS